MANVVPESAEGAEQTGPDCEPKTERTFKDAFKAFKGLKGDVAAACKKLRLDIVDSSDPESWNALPFRSLPKAEKIDVEDPVWSELGLVPADQWEAKQIPSCPGGIILRNPFTKQGQWRWMRQTLTEYPVRNDLPSNLDSHWPFPGTTRDSLDWWTSVDRAGKHGQERPTKKRKIGVDSTPTCSLTTCPIWKLRWITLGYHHDWDSKVYSEEKKTPFPDDLSHLCAVIAYNLGFEEFTAQAAIVNYYHLDSTLSFHQDVSEPYQEAPLISISFGQPAVFLIGAEKSRWPTSVMLRSGDVFIMTGLSRLAYHGVPKVFRDGNLDFMTEENRDSDGSINRYLEASRINVNVRQVLRPGQTALPSVKSTDIRSG